MGLIEKYIRIRRDINRKKVKMEDNRYKNGKIYRLVNTVDDEQYIGSTCTSLAKRLYKHKQSAKLSGNRYVYQHLNNIGWDSVRIILIEEYECENKMELERRERYWIEELKASLNQRIPTRTNKEWREANHDAELQRVANWQSQNREIVKKYKDKYSAENKDKTKARLAEYRAKNAEKIRAANLKYRIDNKEKEQERRAKYRAENRDKINAYRRERRAKKKAEKEANQSS